MGEGGAGGLGGRGAGEVVTWLVTALAPYPGERLRQLCP